MKLKALIIVLITMLGMSVTTQAFEILIVDSKQYNKWTTSENFKTGIKALDDYDYDDAINAFNKELKLHPANAYASINKLQAEFALAEQALFERVYQESISEDDIKKAIDEATVTQKAILDKMDNAISKLNKADNVSLCTAYLLKGEMLERANYEESDSALINDCYDKALALHPCSEAYSRHVAFNHNNSDILKADYTKWHQLEPTNTDVLSEYISLIFNEKDYTKTLQLIDEYKTLKAESPELLLLKAYSLKNLGSTDEAILVALSSFKEDPSNDALACIMDIAKGNPQRALAEIKSQIVDDDELQPLGYIVSGMIESDINHNYSKALENYQNAQLTVKNAPILPFLKSQSYYMLGDDSKALINLDATCALSSFDGLNAYRDAMKLALGMTDELIKEKSELIAVDSECGIYRHNDYNILCKALLQEGKYDQVVDLMNSLVTSDMAVVLKRRIGTNIDNGDNTVDNTASDDIDYVTWGYALSKLGKNDQARNVFQEQIDADEDKAAPFAHEIALIELGRADEARTALAAKAAEWEANYKDNISVLELTSTNTYYEIAATYALLGDYDTAVEYMRKHIARDPLPRNFKFMQRDWRFDTMRSKPQYKTIAEMYNN